MQSISGKPFNYSQSLAILGFVIAGFVYSPLFFAGALLVAGLAVAKRHKPLGYSLATFGLVCFLLVLGYGIGKDMAHRDNARGPAAASSALDPDNSSR